MEVGNNGSRNQSQDNLKSESQHLGKMEALWLNRLKGKFSWIFGEKQRVGEPQVIFNLFFAGHATPADRDGLSKQFSKCDIFIPEAYGWTLRDLQRYQDTATGKKSPPNRMLSFFLNPTVTQELKTIHRSGKHVIIIDVSADDPLFRNKEDIFPKSNKNFLKDDFPSTLEYVKASLQKVASFNNQREHYMLSQLKPKVMALLEEYPSLKKRKIVRVLLVLGSFHTRIYHDLRTSNQQVTRRFSTMPLLYFFEEEAERSLQFGGKVDDKLAAKVFLEETLFNDEFIISKWIPLAKTADKVAELSRKIISQFSFEEAREIFEGLKRGENSEELFKAKLAEKGIKIPQREKELDEFLAKLLPPRPNFPAPKPQ